MKKLFKLSLNGSYGWDDYSDFVVAADSPEEARAFVVLEKWGDGPDGVNGQAADFTDPELSSCAEISGTSVYTENTIVCESFHAG